MGDTLFGQDIDTLFAYQTVRIAKIRDRTLGLFRIFMMVAIFFYICIFNIWYKGGHFSFTPVQGVARLQWQEPTKDHCNPADVDCLSDFQDQEDLPYCAEYRGAKPDAVVRDCDYSDARELPKYIMDGVLIPTYIEKYTQLRSCPPLASSCDRKWKFANKDGSLQSTPGEAKPTSSAFVADVGRYTLLIDHNFKTDKPWLAFDDYKMQGYWEDCDANKENCKTHEIKCVHSGCKNLKFTKRPSFLDIARGRYQSWVHPGEKGKALHHRKNFPRHVSSRQLWYDEEGEDESDVQGISLSATSNSATDDSEPNVIAIRNGDVLSLETMLRMAGRTLDETWTNRRGMPNNVRLRGVALVVSIEYYNLKRWTLFSPEDPPWYTIKIEAMQSHKFKDFSVAAEGPNSRDMHMSYGVYVIVKQTGHLAYFDPLYGLVAMTSALALVAVATTITDFIMCSILPRRDEYTAEKYKISHDFSDEKKVIS